MEFRVNIRSHAPLANAHTQREPHEQTPIKGTNENIYEKCLPFCVAVCINTREERYGIDLEKEEEEETRQRGLPYLT